MENIWTKVTNTHIHMKRENKIAHPKCFDEQSKRTNQKTTKI